MGRFLLGSTIVLLLPEGKSAFHADWAAAKPVQLGEAMGTLSR
jgi:phosphatidylserine decarboxylase